MSMVSSQMMACLKEKSMSEMMSSLLSQCHCISKTLPVTFTQSCMRAEMCIIHMLMGPVVVLTKKQRSGWMSSKGALCITVFYV